MQQALEALEDCRHGCEESHNTVSAVAALRAALTEPVVNPPAPSQYGSPELQALILEKLTEPVVEPVCYQYQSSDGAWHPFLNEKHYVDTVADGSWPIRALYTAPPPPAEVPLLTDEEINEQWVKARGTLCGYGPFARFIEALVRQKAGLK